MVKDAFISLSISIWFVEDNVEVVAQLVVQDEETAVWADPVDVVASDVYVVRTESMFIGLFC